MNAISKVGVVALGYAAAVVLAVVVVAIHVASTGGPDAQASSGMSAFGDALLFVAVFGIASLVPTGAAFFFLRSYRPFWVGLAGVSLVVALVGIAAAMLFAADRHSVARSALSMWADLSVLVILVSPFLAVAFLVSGVLTPYRGPRLTLIGAMVLEVAVSAYGGYVWFLPLLFQGPP